jgi:hypothetical protein
MSMQNTNRNHMILFMNHNILSVHKKAKAHDFFILTLFKLKF